MALHLINVMLVPNTNKLKLLSFPSGIFCDKVLNVEIFLDKVVQEDRWQYPGDVSNLKYTCT